MGSLKVKMVHAVRKCPCIGDTDTKSKPKNKKRSSLKECDDRDDEPKQKKHKKVEFDAEECNKLKEQMKKKKHKEKLEAKESGKPKDKKHRGGKFNNECEEPKDKKHRRVKSKAKDDMAHRIKVEEKGKSKLKIEKVKAPANDDDELWE